MSILANVGTAAQQAGQEAEKQAIMLAMALLSLALDLGLLMYAGYRGSIEKTRNICTK